MGTGGVGGGRNRGPVRSPKRQRKRAGASRALFLTTGELTGYNTDRPCSALTTNVTTVRTRKTTKRSCAIEVAVPAMPPKAESGGDQRQHEEDKRPTKHDLLLIQKLFR